MSHQPTHKRGWKKKGVGYKKVKTLLKRFRPRKHHIKTAVLAAVALGILGSIGIIGAFAYISKDLPDPNSLTERTIQQSTKIYDRTGEHLLYEIYGDENRTIVKLQEGFCKDNPKMEFSEQGIPLYALQATLAAEDRKFCRHHGFDFKGFARAILQNIQGNRVGGSTLTQQLVKNAILSNEKTITRKVKELILSLELERKNSKDEILQIYFNEIPYGSTYYGIQAASENFFNKPVHELTLAEAATLAALPQAPTRYLNNPDRLEARRNWILDSMAELGYQSQEAVDAAKQEETPVQLTVNEIKAPHFVFYVKELLEETYGRRTVEEGGLRVITTLDYEKQAIGEETVKEIAEQNGERLGFSNASLVAMDPKNGHILTMVGSKDFFDEEIDGQVNVALRLRQPGSSFKPIVYTRAFEMGYTPNTLLWDVKTNFPTTSGTYSPNNYDFSQRGPVTLRSALQWSLNIPAVKALYLIGVDNALDFAERLGYTSFTDRANYGLAIVLGGGEVRLLEHVGAYSAFANEGVRHDSVAILRVEDPNGSVLEEWKPSEGKRAVDQNAARMISNVLSDNNARAAVFGTNSNLQLGGRPVAAKTGTTNDYHDAWTVGYTPSLVAGVWGGNNDNSEMNRGSGGSTVAAPIWNTFMRRALENTPVEQFAAPNIPSTGKAMLDGQIQSETVTIDKASGKLATEYTPPSYQEEKTFAQYHTILHYVDRSNPLGDVPQNPASDPHYNAWEGAVAAWVATKAEADGTEIETSKPPEEYDDLHVPENFPTIQLTEPREGDKIFDRTIYAEVSGSAPRGIQRVDFYLDNIYLGTDTFAPFSLTTEIPNGVDRGYHTLKAVAFDDIDNSGTDSVGIRIESSAQEASISLVDPKNGQTITRTSDTYTVVASLNNPSNYRSIVLYAQPIHGGAERVAAVLNPSSPYNTFSWNLPTQEGDWILSAVASPKDQDAREVRSPNVLIHIDIPKQQANKNKKEETNATPTGFLPLFQ